MKKLRSLTVFFPFYNDAGTVAEVIESAYYYGKKITNDLEVIAIHGGKSKDHTLTEIKKQKKIHKDMIIIDKTDNREGYAVIKYGLSTATKDWIFYTDGDLQYHLDDLEKLIIKQKQTRADVVNGYKIDRKDRLLRILFGYSYRLFTKIFNLPIRDLDCDFRLIRKRFIDNIDFKAHNSSILLELIIKLKKNGAKFAEIGVKHYSRSYGYSSFSIWQLIKEKFFGDLKVWRACLKEKY